MECGWNAGGMQHVCYLVSFRLHNDVGMGHLWRVAGAHSTVGAVQMPLQTRRRGRYAHARNAGEMRVECGAMPGGTPHTCSACDDDALSISRTLCLSRRPVCLSQCCSDFLAPLSNNILHSRKSLCDRGSRYGVVDACSRPDMVPLRDCWCVGFRGALDTLR